MHNHSTLEEAPFSVVKSSTSAEQAIRNCSKKKNRMSHSFQVCSNAFHNLTASLSNIRLSSGASSSGTNGHCGRKKKLSTTVRKTNSNASDSDHFSSNGHSDLTMREKREPTGNGTTKVGKEYTCDGDGLHYNSSRVKCYSVYDDSYVVEDGVIDGVVVNDKRTSCYFDHHVPMSRSQVAK